jgi:hypothetical protein
MYVTFEPHFTGHGQHSITCHCGAATAASVYANFMDAYEAAFTGTVTLACADERCFGAPRITAHEPPPHLTLTDQEAQHLLKVLGFALTDDFEDHRSGQVDATSFLGRVLLATALTSSTGSVQGHLVDLVGIAETARAANLPVVWS